MTSPKHTTRNKSVTACHLHSNRIAHQQWVELEWGQIDAVVLMAKSGPTSARGLVSGVNVLSNSCMRC